jgi:hypothetical protein
MATKEKVTNNQTPVSTSVKADKPAGKKLDKKTLILLLSCVGGVCIIGGVVGTLAAVGVFSPSSIPRIKTIDPESVKPADKDNPSTVDVDFGGVNKSKVHASYVVENQPEGFNLLDYVKITD